MDSSVVIALIVSVPTVLATTLVPLVLKIVDNKTRREERAADLAVVRATADKADQVARQAQEAARLLSENTEIARQTTKNLSDTVNVVSDKVDVVHVLVNSQLTSAIEKLMEAKTDLLLLLKKYRPMDKAGIEVLELEIAELRAVLADRRKQTIAVEAMEKQQKSKK